jgi:hypothetical protein
MPKSSVADVSSLFHEKSFQIALVGAILFLFVAHPVLFDLVDRMFAFVGINLGETLLTVVHSVVFATALYYSIMVILKLEA